MLNGYALRRMATPLRCRGVSYVYVASAYQLLHKKRATLGQDGPAACGGCWDGAMRISASLSGTTTCSPTGPGRDGA